VDRQRIGLWGTFVFAALAVIGMLIQVYLIGGFIFGETGWLDTHKDLGMVVHLFYILTFLSALLAAWPNWRATAWPFGLALLGSIQAFLAGGGDVGGDNGALHAFHAALVPVVFVIALVISWRAYTALGLGSPTAVPPPRPEEPLQ
jgi:Family of unknown function (DUF6220)